MQDHVVDPRLTEPVQRGVIRTQPGGECLGGVVDRREHRPQCILESGARDGDESRVITPFDQVLRREGRRVPPPVRHKLGFGYDPGRLVRGEWVAPPPIVH
jgi:hypothetical protein